MSYFMLTFGEKIDLSNFSPAKLVQVVEAQAYFQPIAQATYKEINLPAFLVDDGENHTSDLLIDEAEDMFTQDGDFKSTKLFKIIKLLTMNGNGILIWWANNNPSAYMCAEKCTSLDMLVEFATEQLRTNHAIQVFLPPK